MRRPGTLTALLLSSLVLASACASTMTVSSHVDRAVDFKQYKTYDWGPADTLPTGDPRLDANPLFKDHLQGEVERQLAARGFQQSPGEPDLLIHYHANISERLDATKVDRGRGYGIDDSAQAREYEAGTIVIDLVDRRTNKVVWRGWAQDAVADMLASQDKMAEKVREAVTRMLARLPSRM